jgi:CRP-like cAMP-binding protein
MYKYGNAVYDDNEIKLYMPGEIISEQGDAGEEAGVILDGTAFLESTDSDGTRRIIDIYEEGDIFIKESFPASDMESIYLAAKTKCTVRMLKASELAEGAVNAEAYRLLLSHIHILGRPSLRQKIMAFFEAERERQKSNPFIIGTSFSDLADFIGADRSAMMRELKKMSDEKIIKRSGRAVEII